MAAAASGGGGAAVASFMNRKRDVLLRATTFQRRAVKQWNHHQGERTAVEYLALTDDNETTRRGADSSKLAVLVWLVSSFACW